MRGLGRDAEALGALEDELRRDLYVFVRSQGRPVTRDEAASAVAEGQGCPGEQLPSRSRAATPDRRMRMARPSRHMPASQFSRMAAVQLSR